MKISYFDPSFPIWTKSKEYHGENIWNVSPTWENPNMDSHRLESVKKYFQKTDFQETENSEIKNQDIVPIKSTQHHDTAIYLKIKYAYNSV